VLQGWCNATDADTTNIGYDATWYKNNTVYERMPFTYISMGRFHTCGILTNGSASCWGYSNEGELGNGGTTEQDNPVLVDMAPPFKTISAGYSHTCGILTNGSAYCWGDSTNGQLGYGGITQ